METQERFNAVKDTTADFYGTHTGRVSSLARLTAIPDDDDDDDGDGSSSEGGTGAVDADERTFDTAGVLMVFNAKTNADATRFVASEPAVAAGLFQQWTMAPINVQDVDGQNHLMARKFGERVVLDQVPPPPPPPPSPLHLYTSSFHYSGSSLQILTPPPTFTATLLCPALSQVHFMDPEDLLFEESGVGTATTGNALNKAALDYMSQAGRSFRYDRLDLDTRFRSEIAEEVPAIIPST